MFFIPSYNYNSMSYVLISNPLEEIVGEFQMD